MLVSIVVNLYTVRLLWRVLGIDNYGIYNLVGGIVMMFAFLNSAMVASSQRFISFELGRGDKERLQKTFSISVTVHSLLAIVVLFLAETIGLWFLNVKLNIPTDRMVAANWVYQCSIIAFLLNVVSVPYNACIVAHEHMKIYGYFGILDVFLKLIIVLIISVLPFDKLISYAIMILIVSAVMRFIYGLYCSNHFEECHFKSFKDKTLMKDMFSFAGWSFLGNMGFSVRDQGLNIIVNMFFNVSVNAAKGIANQVSHVINGFASNFTMSINPQITKRYAIGDVKSMMNLVFNGCKYSILLMSFVVIPLIISADNVLHLWLGDVAPFTVGFLQLTLVLSWIECMVSPITTSLQATGNIKKFQILISIIMVANLPLGYVGLKLYLDPYVVMYICFLTSIIALVTRLILVHEIIRFSYREFLVKVYARTIPCVLISGLLLYFIYNKLPYNLIGLIGFGVSSVAVISILTFVIALTNNERSAVTKLVRHRISAIF